MRKILCLLSLLLFVGCTDNEVIEKAYTNSNVVIANATDTVDTEVIEKTYTNSNVVVANATDTVETKAIQQDRNYVMGSVFLDTGLTVSLKKQETDYISECRFNIIYDKATEYCYLYNLSHYTLNITPYYAPNGTLYKYDTDKKCLYY